MNFGLAYMGHHDPEMIRRELEDIRRLGFSEVVLTCQENDFVTFTGKVEYTPGIARELGLTVLVNLWGYASAFGGGRISRLVADYPEVMVRDRAGRPKFLNWPEGNRTQPGCPNHPLVQERARQHVDAAIKAGAHGFFWDEPTKFDCYCEACRALFRTRGGGDLATAGAPEIAAFRNFSVAHWVEEMSRYVKSRSPQLVTSTCVMPSDRDAWDEAAGCPSLDSLGTDTYWEFDHKPLDWMEEPCRALVAKARAAKKSPHLWLQCWALHRGREAEITEAAKMLASYGADTLYVWAYKAQLGTNEACEDPARAWSCALNGLRAVGLGH